MAKQKYTTQKKVSATPARRKIEPSPLHKKRIKWFAVLIFGLVFIQLAYNIRSAGQPQVLGYATAMSSDVLLKGTNDYRTKAGLMPLNINSQLAQAAQAKAQSMVAANYWSHIAPDGTTPWDYVQRSGYKFSTAGENLAYGFSTSDQVIAAWMNSAEHRANVLGGYADVGFGFVNGPHYQHGNNTVVVALYGLPMGQKPAITNQPVDRSNLSTPTTNLTSQHVAGISTIVDGQAPWATYASLALIGATAMGIIVTHIEFLRLGWRSAKQYVVVHPVVDAFVLIGLALIVIGSTGGFIR